MSLDQEMEWQMAAYRESRARADEEREAQAEAAAAFAEYEWRDRHLSMLDEVLKALGPADVLQHVAGFLLRPPRTPVTADETEPF